MPDTRTPANSRNRASLHSIYQMEEARWTVPKHTHGLEPALVIDISANKEWVAYITKEKILKIKPLGVLARAATDEGMAETASPTPVELNIADWFKPDNDYCYFLSVSSDGRRAAVSFLAMNSVTCKADDLTNANKECFVFRRKEVGPYSGFGLEQPFKFNGRAVFLNNGNLALVNENVLEVYDCDKSYKKIHWFNLRALTTTNTGIHSQEVLDGSEPVIDTPWANFENCSAIIKRDFSAARTIIKVSKLIRHNVITTPYANICRVWSLIEDGAQLTSFRSDDTEEILAFSESYKYVATSVKENNSIKVYTVKSGIVISRLKSVLEDSIKKTLVNEGKTSDYRINHAHFCKKGQYLVVISIDKLARNDGNGNNAIIIFEVWDIFAEKSIYHAIDYIAVRWEKDMPKGDVKCMQPFIHENSVDTMSWQPEFIAMYATLDKNGACQLKEKLIYIYSDKYALEGDVDDAIISNKNWRIPFQPPFKKDVKSMPVYLEQTIGDFRYILRFGSQTVQLWKCSKTENSLDINKDELIYIRAFKAPSYRFDDAFDENWIRKTSALDADEEYYQSATPATNQTRETVTINTEAMKQSINKSILFMKNNSEGRVVVIIRSKDTGDSSIHTDEIFLPLKHLNNPSTSIKYDFRHEHHYFASACQALYHLWSYRQNTEYENDELEMEIVKTMLNKTLAIVNRSIRAMKLIKSKYFTTISGSNTLALLASMLGTFPDGRSILLDIIKTEELEINLLSYIRVMPDGYRRIENALVLLIELQENNLFKLLFNRVVLHSKKLGTGSCSALSDSILFLQERGNSDLLFKSCQKLSYMQISTKVLTLLPSEKNEEMSMVMLYKAMTPDYQNINPFSALEQIPKYTNHWFLDGWLSLSSYWWSIYMTYGIKGKIMRWWHRIKMIKWVKLAIHFFAPNGGMTNRSLIELCVVPLDQFSSYSEFPVDRHKDNNDVGDSSFIERWLYEIPGRQIIKLAQDAGILYKQKESDAVIPHKNISAFIQSATNQHENDVLFQGESVFEAIILHKWKKFARKRFFAMYLICFTYYISYTLSVLFPRETFGYTLGTTITNNRGHLACISLMFITGGLLFIQEVHQFSKIRSRFAYLTCPYNVLDILACVLPAISFWQVINNYAGIGITLETIIQLVRSVYKVLFIMLLVIFAFTHAFMVLLSHKEDSFFQEQYKGSVNLRSSGEAFSDENEVAFHDTSANNNFGNPFKAFSIVWFFVWGVWDPINDGDAGDDYMVILLAIMFSLLAVLLFINLIIALMSSKVEEVKKRGKKVWISHFAAVVAEIELLWCTKSERRSRNNNPAFVYYVAKRSDIMHQRESLMAENDLLIQKIRAQIEAANEKSLNYQIFDSITELCAKIQEAEDIKKPELLRRWRQVLLYIEDIN